MDPRSPSAVSQDPSPGSIDARGANGPRPLPGNRRFDPTQPIKQFLASGDYASGLGAQPGGVARAGTSPLALAPLNLGDMGNPATRVTVPGVAEAYLRDLYPGLAAFDTQNTPHQGNSVIEHTRLGLANLAEAGLSTPQKKLLRLAWLFHDVGKLANGRDPNHQDLSVPGAIAALSQYRLTPPQMETVQVLIGNHHAIGDLMRGEATRRQPGGAPLTVEDVARACGTAENARLLVRMWETDVRAVPGFADKEFGAPALGIPLSRNWADVGQQVGSRIASAVDDLVRRGAMQPLPAALAVATAAPDVSVVRALPSSPAASALPATALADLGRDRDGHPLPPPARSLTEPFPDARTALALPVLQDLGGSTHAMKVGSPGGSAGGTAYVRKEGGAGRGGAADTQRHVREEIATDGIYAALGVRVAPSIGIVDPATSKVIKFSKFLTGRSYNSLGAGTAELRDVRKQLAGQFVADAFLGNWDVIGDARENVLVGDDGVAYRIDNGGGMRHRAQGDLKTRGQFNAGVMDLWSMREQRGPRANTPVYEVFKSLKPAELATQAEALVASYRGNREAVVAAVAGAHDPGALQATLDSRIDSLAEYARQVRHYRQAGRTDAFIEEKTEAYQKALADGRPLDSPVPSPAPGQPSQAPPPEASSGGPSGGVARTRADLRPPGIAHGEYVQRTRNLPFGEPIPYESNMEVPGAVYAEAKTNPGLNYARAFGMSCDGATGDVVTVYHGAGAGRGSAGRNVRQAILAGGMRPGGTNYFGLGLYCVVNGADYVPNDFGGAGIIRGEYHAGRTCTANYAFHTLVPQWKRDYPEDAATITDESHQKCAAALAYGYSTLRDDYSAGNNAGTYTAGMLVCLDPARFRIMSIQERASRVGAPAQPMTVPLSRAAPGRAARAATTFAAWPDHHVRTSAGDPGYIPIEPGSQNRTTDSVAGHPVLATVIPRLAPGYTE